MDENKEDMKPYLVSFEGEEYMGFKRESGWSLIPVDDSLKRQTGESFFVSDSESVEIKNHMLFPPSTKF